LRELNLFFGFFLDGAQRLVYEK